MSRIINLSESPGYKFLPEKQELVGFYLKRRLLGQPLPPNPKIIEDDVYRDHPYSLLKSTKDARAVQDQEHDTEGYFFTNLKMTSTHGKRISRSVANWGSWKEQHTKDVKVYDKSRKSMKLIGFQKYYKFMPTLGKQPEENDGVEWQMHEYSIKNKKDIVLCHIVAKNSKKRDYDATSLSDHECEQSKRSCVEDNSEVSSSNRLQFGVGSSTEGCSSSDQLQVDFNVFHQEDDDLC